MKKIEIEILPFKDAPKNGNVILSWWDKKPVFIAWRSVMKTKYEEQEQKWYLPYKPSKCVEYDDGYWCFVDFNAVNGEWNPGVKCGLFRPEEYALLPYYWNAKEVTE